MGIDQFHKCLRQNYSGAFNNMWLNSYDHVYIDINFALHYCSHNAKNIEEIHARLFIFLDGILRELVPTKTLTLGSDGSAPLSKVILQRKRRSNIFRNLKNDVGTSSLMFTPGTNFMIDLKTKIKEYIKYINNVYCIIVNYLDVNIDEAELKLKKQMMNNLADPKYENDSHIIVSNDADVIVMLTTLTDYTNVFVLNINSHQHDVISMGKLMDLHTDKVGMSMNPGLDFTAIGVMLGNDYLPKIYFIDFNKMWNAYKKIISADPQGLFLNDDPKNLKINILFFKNLLSATVIQMKECFIKKLVVDDVFHPLYKNYLDGYMWCLHTYITGECNRYNYMYNYKDKRDTPHPLGLIFNIDTNSELLKVNTQVFDPINPALYAILILPQASLCLINKKYHAFANKNKILYEEECCDKCENYDKKIKTLNCKKENINDNNDEIEYIKKNMKIHKKQHINITLVDIEDIINKFNESKLN
jgi:hypothetical protein